MWLELCMCLHVRERDRESARVCLFSCSVVSCVGGSLERQNEEVLSKLKCRVLWQEAQCQQVYKGNLQNLFEV